MSRATRGTIEAAVASAMVRFHREQQGRGPTEARAHLIGDLLLVRCSGIFTPTETKLSATDDGRKLIKSARQELRGISRAEAEEAIQLIVGCKVLRSYYDVDVEVAEQIEVYVLEFDLDKRLLREPPAQLTNSAPQL